MTENGYVVLRNISYTLSINLVRLTNDNKWLAWFVHASEIEIWETHITHKDKRRIQKLLKH